MRIEHLAIEGFGILHRRELDLSSPVTVLLGPNEAGKSTAAAFIRTMLYGFPQRRSGVERYEPLASGKHGGRLTLLTDREQTLTIERFDTRDGLRIWDEQGSRWSEAELQRAIGGYQGEWFRRMFAFSLSELQEVRLLESEDVGRYLYMVGLGHGGGKSILEAERRLTVEMERLFKQRGSVQRIPQKAREVEEWAAKLKAARGQSEAYNALLDQWQACEQAIRSAEDEIQQLRTQLNRLDVSLEAREDWMAYREVEKRLATLPDFGTPLPAHAANRLEQWREREDQLQEQQQQARWALQECQTERSSLVLLDGREEFRQRLEPLLERVTAVLGDRERLKELKLEQADLEAGIARSVRAISPDWTIAELRQYPMSQAEYEQVRSFQDSLGRLQAAADRLDTEHREREDRLQVARNAWQETEDEWKQLLEERRRYPELDAIPYVERTRLIRQFLREAARCAELEREAVHLRDRLADVKRRQQWHQEIPTRRDHLKRGPQATWETSLTWAGWSGAVAGLAGFAARGEWDWAIGSVVVGGLFILVPKLWFRWKREERQQEELSPPERSADEELVERLHQEWLVCEQQREQAAIRSQELLARLMPASRSIAATAMKETQELMRSVSAAEKTQRKRPELGQELMDIARWRETLAELLPLEEKLEMHEHRRQERARDMQRAQEQWEQTETRLADNKAAFLAERERWAAWLSHRKLPQDISPEAALALLHTIEQGQGTAERAEHGSKQIALLASRVTAFEEAICSLHEEFPLWFDGANIVKRNLSAVVTELDEAASAAEWSSCLKALQRKLQEQEALARRAAELEQQANEWEQTLESLDQARLRIVQERELLLQEAGVKEESELRRRAEQEEEKGRLTEQQQHLEHVLRVRLGGKPLAELDQVWEQHTWPEIQTKRELLDRQLRERLDEQQRLVDRKARLEHERASLIQDEEYAALLQSYQEAKHELRELAAQWTVRALAQEAFRLARDTYEQERQPAVMQQASVRFSQITGGTYKRVYTTLGEGKLEVEDARGSRLDPGQLSRGTREQLLLAIRFALAEETADRVAMPLLMDDVFVNFDPERLGRCWDIVHEMSARHQIVYFTCHPHIAEAARRRHPDVTLIHL